MAETIPTKILINGEETIIDAAPQFTMLVHQQGIRVDVPDFIKMGKLHKYLL